MDSSHMVNLITKEHDGHRWRLSKPPFSHLEVGFRQNQACSLAPQVYTILGWTVSTSGRKVLPSKVNGGHQEGQQYQGI